MDAVARTGFSGVGLTLAALDELGAAGCAKAARERGLTITTLNSAGNCTVTDPEARARARSQNSRLVTAAAEMGAGVLVVVTGGLSGQPFIDDMQLRSLPLLRPGVALQMVEDELALLNAEAWSQGVRLAIEPIHPMDVLFKGVVNSISSAVQLADRIEGLGIILDLYHSWWDPDLFSPPPAAVGIQISGLQQANRDVKPDRDVLGEGIVDPAPVLAAFRSSSPQGFVEFEMFDRQRLDRPVEDIIRSVAEAWSNIHVSIGA
jgi:sugar phosphate isomerase/epimerase